MKTMWLPLCSLWLLTMTMLHWASADDSIFCARPANMELCWWNNVNKRYLRFGRGDPFLRFGRSQGSGSVSWRFNPFLHMGKRNGDSDSLEKILENGGYLRFGRSMVQPSLMGLLASEEGQSMRKKRDVTEASSGLQRQSRSPKDGGFLRFGRRDDFDFDTGMDDVQAALKIAGEKTEVAKEAPAKKADAGSTDLANSDREYLRFGRARPSGFPRFGKRNYLRFGRGSPEGYLRFGKRAMERV